MLSRDQVLHVARLARIDLTDAEVERLGSELARVVDFVETINALGDLEGVEPTSHVVAQTNVLREDEPRPSLPVAVALDQAPDAGENGFRVPSPSGGGE